jgi:hypothetical protein
MPGIANKLTLHSPHFLLSPPLKKGKWHVGAATPDHTPAGRGWQQHMIYFDGANGEFYYPWLSPFFLFPRSLSLSLSLSHTHTHTHTILPLLPPSLRLLDLTERQLP